MNMRHENRSPRADARDLNHGNNMKFHYLIAAGVTAAAAIFAAAGPALADEVWVTQTGERIVYETDIDDIAVLSINDPGSGLRHLYVPGLGGNYSDRGQPFFGYWIDAGAAGKSGGRRCGAILVGPDGMESDQFGSARIEFDSRAFPSGFTAAIGPCFDPARQTLMRADPVTSGGGAQTGAGLDDECSRNTVFPIAGDFEFQRGVRYPAPCSDHYVIFQTDGNLVIYTGSDQPIWALNSLNTPWYTNVRAVFQADGILATYNFGGRPNWFAHRREQPAGTRLFFTPAGELEIRTPNGEMVWRSGVN